MNVVLMRSEELVLRSARSNRKKEVDDVLRKPVFRTEIRRSSALGPISWHVKLDSTVVFSVNGERFPGRN